MNAQMNGLLEQIRSRLDEGEEAFGPDSKQDTEHGDGEAGESGAENVSDVLDSFDLYLDEIVTDLLDEYEMSEDEAVDFVFSLADELEADGKLPALPEDEEDEQGFAEWLGKAKTLGFEGLVLAAADEAAED